MARSTTIGCGAGPRLSTIAPKRRPIACGNSAATWTLKRRLAPIAKVFSTDVPSSKINVVRTDAGASPVLAIRMNVCAFRAPPCSPSARPHLVPVATAPALPCPSYHSGPLAGHHMARSTRTGTPLVLVTIVDTAALASAGSSVCTPMVSRLLAAATCVLVTTRPSASR